VHGCILQGSSLTERVTVPSAQIYTECKLSDTRYMSVFNQTLGTIYWLIVGKQFCSTLPSVPLAQHSVPKKHSVHNHYLTVFVPSVCAYYTWYSCPLPLDPCDVVIFVLSVLKTLGTM
jgi:hypothetical protein